MLNLKPSEIRYSQDSISCTFTGQHKGKKIGQTLDELVDGKIKVDHIPRISVIFRNEKWFTCDNRRLWVFKHFEQLGGCTHISATKTTYLDVRKLTTDNDGTDIYVRGSPGGTWYNKYTENPTKYRNYLRNQSNNPYSDSFASSHVDSFRSGLPTSYHESSLRMQAKNDRRYDTDLTNVRKDTDTSHAFYGFQQHPLFGYHNTDYTDKMVSRSTSVTAKTVLDSSPSPFSPDQISCQSSSNRTETPSPIAIQLPLLGSSYQSYSRPISESSLKETRQGLTLSSSGSSKLGLGTRNYLLPAERIAAQSVHKSTLSTFNTGLASNQNLSGRTETPTSTSKATLGSFLYQTDLSSAPESSLKNTRQASTLSSSNSSGTRNYPAANESGVSLSTKRSSEHMTSSSESETASKRKVYSAWSVAEPVKYQDKNKIADVRRPLSITESSLPAMRTANVEGLALKGMAKVKPASRQHFANIITVQQNQCYPKKSVLIMLDISIIRYTKDTIECPFSDERKAEVLRRLHELLHPANTKPIEVYKAYDLYWLKKEHDVLLTLKYMEDSLEGGKTMGKVKALVTEDNDAFLEFMRKDKPWLQISDILQLGQKIELIK